MTTQPPDKTAADVTSARVKLALRQPFFGNLALGWTAAAEPNTARFAADGKALFYNADHVATLTDSQLTGELAQIALATALKQQFRMKGKNPKTWSLACQLVNAEILTQHNPISNLPLFELAPDSPRNPDFDGMSAEDAYRKLTEGDQDDPDGDPSPGPGDDQDEDGEPTPGQGDDEDGDQDGDSQGDGDQDDDGDGDQGDGDEPSFELLPPPPEMEEGDQDIQTALAARAAKAIDRMPGGMEKLVLETISPRADAIEQVKRYLDTTARDTEDWCSPDRRFISDDLYFPSPSGRRLGHVCLVTDTSYSMAREELQNSIEQTLGLIQSYSPEKITRIEFCEHVAVFEVIEHGDEYEPPTEFTRGGTCIAPVFERLDEEGAENIAVMIIFSDMEIDDWPEEPDFPVLCVGTSPPRSYNAPPDYAEYIDAS